MIFRVDAKTRRYVAQRAGNACEYCLIAEEDSFFRHQIEHIISLKHGDRLNPKTSHFPAYSVIRTKEATLARSSRAVASSYDSLTRAWIDGRSIFGWTEG
jgi:hypothetical protein